MRDQSALFRDLISCLRDSSFRHRGPRLRRLASCATSVAHDVDIRRQAGTVSAIPFSPCPQTGKRNRFKSPSARFRNWCRGRRFRRRGRSRYVLFDQVPKHCRGHEGDQLRAPVFQGQSDEQDGDQLRAAVFRDHSFHNCCATKFPRYAGEML